MRIVAAAIELEAGLIAAVPRPGRHGDVMRLLARGGYPIPIDGVQGFLTDGGIFVDRFLGRKIAAEAGQLVTRASAGDELFSEDVW